MQAEAMRLNTFAVSNMNMLQNAGSIMRDQHWAAARARYSGTQVLLVGCGPSAALNDSALLRELSSQKYRSKVTVIACDNALPHLLRCGVKPDIVCCVEWQSSILDAFKDIDLQNDLNPGDGTLFAYAPGIAPAVLRLWREIGQHPCLAIPCVQTQPMLGFYASGCGAGEGVKPFRGSNVGMLAAQVAFALFPQSVWLLGLDLSCPDGGYFSPASNSLKPVLPIRSRHNSIEAMDLMMLAGDGVTVQQGAPAPWAHPSMMRDADALALFLREAREEVAKAKGRGVILPMPDLYSLSPSGLEIEGVTRLGSLEFFCHAEIGLNNAKPPVREGVPEMLADGITWEEGYEDVFPNFLQERISQVREYRSLASEMLEAARGLTVAEVAEEGANSDESASERDREARSEYVVHASTRLADATKCLHGCQSVTWVEPTIAMLDPRVERVFSAAREEIEGAKGLDRLVRWAHVICNYYQKLLDYSCRLEDCLTDLAGKGVA